MDEKARVNKTEIAVSVFDKNAELYEKKYMDISSYHKGLDIFCKNLVEGQPNVLELACGPGNVTSYMLSKMPDMNLLATDLAPNMLRVAAGNNPGAQFQLLDCREIGTLDKKFDGIVNGFGFPYLSKEEVFQFIKDAGKVLNSHGMIYLSTMEDDNDNSGWETGSTGEKVYMNYHEGTYIINALENEGFEIIDEERIVYPRNGTQTTTDLIIIAKKN